MTAPELIWQPAARQDLLEIYILIGMENPIAAEKFYDTIEEKTQLLIDYPHLGPRRPDLFKAARMLVEGAYLVLYENHPDSDEGNVDTVTVVRVLDGRRNLMRLM